MEFSPAGHPGPERRTIERRLPLPGQTAELAVGIVEDYRSIGVNLDDHRLALLREKLGQKVARSTDLARIDDGATVEIAGMVVARQRPGTAKGITFVLLEDERGAANQIVPSDLYERRREAVRSAPLMRAQGRLERREGVIDVLVFELGARCGGASRRARWDE